MSVVPCAQARVIEVLASKDARFRVAGQDKPQITLKPGEHVVLRITAERAKTWSRDGSVHGFTLLRASTRTKVPGWDLFLKPGTHDFTLVAPKEPGQYVAICSVICGPDHQAMRMKLNVVP